MVVRGVSPGRGSEARRPEPKISEELKRNVKDVLACPKIIPIISGTGAKINGYSKDVPNKEVVEETYDLSLRTMDEIRTNAKNAPKQF